MNRGLSAQFGVTRKRPDFPRTDKYWCTVMLGKNFDIIACPRDHGCADETHRHRLGDPPHCKCSGETVDLGSVGVAVHRNIQKIQRYRGVLPGNFGRDEDRPRTHAEYGEITGFRARDNRRIQTGGREEFGDHRALATRNDEVCATLQIGGFPDEENIRFHGSEQFDMFCEISLQCQHADGGILSDHGAAC